MCWACQPDPYADLCLRKPDELADLIRTSRSVFSSFAKAKTAKLGGSFPGVADWALS